MIIIEFEHYCFFLKKNRPLMFVGTSLALFNRLRYIRFAKWSNKICNYRLHFWAKWDIAVAQAKAL